MSTLLLASIITVLQRIHLEDFNLGVIITGIRIEVFILLGNVCLLFFVIPCKVFPEIFNTIDLIGFLIRPRVYIHGCRNYFLG